MLQGTQQPVNTVRKLGTEPHTHTHAQELSTVWTPPPPRPPLVILSPTRGLLGTKSPHVRPLPKSSKAPLRPE